MLFAAADKYKLKMHNKNQDILNCPTGMVGGWYACVLKFFNVANFCNYHIQTHVRNSN